MKHIHISLDRDSLVALYEGQKLLLQANYSLNAIQHKANMKAIHKIQAVQGLLVQAIQALDKEVIAQ